MTQSEIMVHVLLAIFFIGPAYIFIVRGWPLFKYKGTKPCWSCNKKVNYDYGDYFYGPVPLCYSCVGRKNHIIAFIFIITYITLITLYWVLK